MVFHQKTHKPGLRQDGFKTQRNPRIPPDLVDWLKENFPAKCISKGQSLEDAHRYAGMVELASKLIGFAIRGEDEPHYMIQED